MRGKILEKRSTEKKSPQLHVTYFIIFVMKRIFPSAAVGPENLERERGKFDDKLTRVSL